MISRKKPTNQKNGGILPAATVPIPNHPSPLIRRVVLQISPSTQQLSHPMVVFHIRIPDFPRLGSSFTNFPTRDQEISELSTTVVHQ